jgi:hypothetical protein
VFFEDLLADCLTGKRIEDILHPKVCFAGLGLFASLTTLPFLVGVRLVADMLSLLALGGARAVGVHSSYSLRLLHVEAVFCLVVHQCVRLRLAGWFTSSSSCLHVTGRMTLGLT